ncbi:hypothetical protein BDB01DRAFT_872346 [Pilobolus umbonatus]|nr:hypothetical protein BDB01DRAFT_872346 [Pilobolus umbonatus]
MTVDSTSNNYLHLAYSYRASLLSPQRVPSHIYDKRSTWNCRRNSRRTSGVSSRRSSRRVVSWKPHPQSKKKRVSSISKKSSISVNIRRTIATISSLTSSLSQNDIDHLIRFHKITAFENHQIIVFHTQSILFVFGFLFFPCWWIGGFCMHPVIEHDIEKLKDKSTLMVVHPSLLANSRTSSRLICLMDNEHYIQNAHYHSILSFHRWNRIMTFVSFGLIVIFIVLIVWYYVQYK